MEKGLSKNSLEAYASDLDGFLTFMEPRTAGHYPDAEALLQFINSL
jgi:site-specific recombinase XerD